ncbi:hypothetical protein Tco_0663609 [Tanacetum coccineum]
MFTLYCERAVSEDLRLAWEINALCDRLTDIIEKKRALLMSWKCWWVSLCQKRWRVFEGESGERYAKFDKVADSRKRDRRFATQLNMLREETANVCEKRRKLAYELRSVRGIIVAGKAAEFMTDTLRKDDVEMAQLCELERQMESS